MINFAIITNPPWNRKLSLPILERISLFSDNVVSVQPINTIQNNIHNHYYKYKKTIGSRLLYYEIIDPQTFPVTQDGDVAILKLRGSSKSSSIYKELILETDDPKIKKVLTKIFKNNLIDMRTYAKLHANKSNSYIVIPTRHGNLDTAGNKKWDYYDLMSRNQQINCPGAKNGIKLFFKNDQEAENFRLSVQTLSYKFIISIFKKTTNSSLGRYPMMPSYEKIWTENEFKNFFNWTNKEFNEIVNIMKIFI